VALRVLRGQASSCLEGFLLELRLSTGFPLVFGSASKPAKPWQGHLLLWL